MGPIYADLHNHTTASDGDYPPAKLVEKAVRIGLRAVGITDHDTVAGLNAAVEYAETRDIEVIPGLEMSIRFKEEQFTGTLHLLCYFTVKRLQDERFTADLAGLLSRGRGIGLVNSRVKEINRIFGPHGSSPLLKRELRADQITALSANASRRHFALALAQTHGIDDTDTVNRIIGNSSPAYLPSGVPLADAAAFLKTHRMITVLAHPAAGSFPGTGHYREVLPPLETVEHLLPRFLDAGLDGIEVFYPGHTPAHMDLLTGWAHTYGLLVTGGSDCHDDRDRPLGISGLTESLFSVFRARLV